MTSLITRSRQFFLQDIASHLSHVSFCSYITPAREVDDLFTWHVPKTSAARVKVTCRLESSLRDIVEGTHRGILFFLSSAETRQWRRLANIETPFAGGILRSHDSRPRNSRCNFNCARIRSDRVNEISRAIRAKQLPWADFPRGAGSIMKWGLAGISPAPSLHVTWN